MNPSGTRKIRNSRVAACPPLATSVARPTSPATYPRRGLWATLQKSGQPGWVPLLLLPSLFFKNQGSQVGSLFSSFPLFSFRSHSPFSNPPACWGCLLCLRSLSLSRSLALSLVRSRSLCFPLTRSAFLSLPSPAPPPPLSRHACLDCRIRYLPGVNPADGGGGSEFGVGEGAGNNAKKALPSSDFGLGPQVSFNQKNSASA